MKALELAIKKVESLIEKYEDWNFGLWGEIRNPLKIEDMTEILDHLKDAERLSNYSDA